jgi:hypothetical protein
MEKFMLIIREDLIQLKQKREAQNFESMREMMKWAESLSESGNYNGGEPLMIAGKYVSRDFVLSDGPFVEAKEGISGYIFLEAENLEQAAAIAQTCPLVQQDRMIIEVRPVMVLNKAIIN